MKEDIRILNPLYPRVSSVNLGRIVPGRTLKIRVNLAQAGVLNKSYTLEAIKPSVGNGEPGQTKIMIITAGDGQTQTISTALATALSINIKLNGVNQNAVPVTFTIVSGSGTIGTPTTATNASGNATTTFTTGATAGTTTVLCSALGSNPVYFTIIAILPALALTKEAGSGDAQSGAASFALAQPIIVTARRGSVAEPNITINWNVTGGGGSVNPSASITDNTGKAATSWTLGSIIGANTLSALSSGLTINYTSTGTINTLTKMLGDTQTAPIQTTLPVALKIKVSNASVALAGVAVSFIVSSGGGTLSLNAGTTGSDGMISTVWTLGSTVGTQQVTVNAGDATAVVFSATATTTTLTINSGNNQSALVDAALPLPVVVKLANGSMLVQGAPVAWTLTGGGRLQTPINTVTDNNGLCSNIWFMGTNPGANTLTATVSGYAPVVFNATGNAYPNILNKFGGDNQSAISGQALANAIDVLVTNRGNPVSGVTVSFGITTGGGSRSPVSAVSSGSGHASTTWTVGTGSNSLTASSSGLSSVIFNATGTVPLLTKTNGDNGSAPYSTALATPLTVRLTNNGIPMSGQTLTWTITQGTGTLSPSSAWVTDANGYCAVTLTFGATPGPFQVSVAHAVAATVIFNETSNPDVLSKFSGDGQTSAKNTSLPLPIVSLVSNSGTPIVGKALTLTVTAGGGSLFPSSGWVTDANGKQSTGWTLGQTTIPQTVTVAGTGLTTQTFSATATGISSNVANDGTIKLGLQYPRSTSNDRTVIRNGVKTAEGTPITNRATLEYNGYFSNSMITHNESYGYYYTQNYTWDSIVFQNGWIDGTNGGYFTATPTVQVLVGATWTNVSSPNWTPAYSTSVSWRVYTCTFTAISGSAIRVVGSAGGSWKFTSCAELEVYGIPIGGSPIILPDWIGNYPTGDTFTAGSTEGIYASAYFSTSYPPTSTGFTVSLGAQDGNGWFWTVPAVGFYLIENLPFQSI